MPKIILAPITDKCALVVLFTVGVISRYCKENGLLLMQCH